LQEEDVAEIAVYTSLVYDDLKALGCNDSDRAATETCSGDIYTTWNNVRALVHTANALSGTGQGSTEFSLGTDANGLIDALRWNAGEEFSSQETMSSRFTSSQVSNITSRIAALRNGASGLSMNGLPSSPQVTTTRTETGMNAGDQLWSPWGGFINGTYSYGNLDPSAREDAFDFDSQDITAGIDYRLNNQWVIGGMLAYVSENIDFDSSKSVVDGTVEMTGLGFTAFALYQTETWYYNVSGGYQTSEFDTNRSIRYTSLNLDIPSPDTVAISNNKGHTISASLAGGYTFQITERFTIDPSLSSNYQQVTIDGFTERDLNNDGFNLQVMEQNFKSLETVAAVKFQYVYNNSMGVFTPFVDLQLFVQHYPDARTIKAVYANLADTLSEEAQMSLLTDKQESTYSSFGIGVASVLRGSSTKTLDGAASGGIQAFIAYRELASAGNFHQHTITGGLRYEF